MVGERLTYLLHLLGASGKTLAAALPSPSNAGLSAFSFDLYSSNSIIMLFQTTL